MASVCIIFFCGLLIAAFFIQSGCALRMEVNPQPFSQLVHSTLDISCIDDGSTARHVVVLQIQRPNQKPIAVINGNEGLSMGPSGTSNIQADGHLDANARRSTLRITISKPGMGDAGVYECAMFYLDSSYQLKEIKMDFNVSIDNEDISSIVTHFTGILQSQARKIEALQDIVSKQNATITKQINHTTDQANQIEQLSVTTREQEQQLKLMKALASYQCAFSVRYSEGNTISDGETLMFTDTVVNIGNAYDVKTGIFSAPRDGLYVFQLIVTTLNGGDGTLVYLEKNGSLEAALHTRDKDYWDTASVSVVLSLLVGDTVKPRVIWILGDDPLWRYASVFSGYLLS